MLLWMLTSLFFSPGQPDLAFQLKLDTMITNWSEQNRFSGVFLLLGKGQILYEKSFGSADASWGIANTPDTLFQIGSVSKQMTSYLALRLKDQGKVDLNSPIATYLPEFQASWADKVTLHHLLSHSSGLGHYDAFPDYRESLFPKNYSRASYLSLIGDLPLNFEPGTRMDYSSFGYYLAGMVLEKAAGKPLEQLLETEVFQPAQLHRSLLDTGQTKEQMAYPYRWDWDAYSYKPAEYRHYNTTFATGGIFATARDLARWTQTVVSGTGLSPESHKLWLREHFPGSGYGWMFTNRKTATGEAQVIYHNGAVTGYTCEYMWLPETDIWLIVLSNNRGYKNRLLPWRIVDLALGNEVSSKKTLEKVLIDTIHVQGLEAGLRAYTRLQEDAPDEIDFANWRAMFFAGLHFLNRHQFAVAEGVYALAAEAFPRNAHIQEYLGLAKEEQGKMAEAKTHFRKAIELDPSKRKHLQPKMEN